MEVPEIKTTASGRSATFRRLFRIHARRVSTGLFIGLLFLFLLFIFLPGPLPFRKAYAPPLLHETDAGSRLQFRTMADSLRWIADFQHELLQKNGYGWRMLRVGVVELDPVPMPGAPPGRLAEKGGRFLQMEGFRICGSCHFSLDNRGGYQVDYLKVHGDGNRWIGYERERVPVRFTLSHARSNQGILWVPLNKYAGLLQWALSFLGLLFAVFLLFVLFVRPIRMLYRVAEGDFFEPGHGRTLQGMALGLVLMGVVPVVLTELSEHLYAAVIPPHFHYPAWEALLEQRPWIGAGVIVFILSLAFKRGYGKDSIV